MVYIKKYVILSVLPVFIITFISCKQTSTQMAHITFFQGDVTVQRNGVDVPVSSGLKLVPSDVIVTRDKAIAVIQIADKAVAHISSNSTVTVQSLLETTVTLYLEKGEVISRVEKLKKGEEYQVRTRSVVASVRGTKFLVSEKEQYAKVAVREGSVLVKPVVAEEKAEVQETDVSEGKVAIVTVTEEKAAKEPVEIQELSLKDSMKIETAAAIEILPQEVLEKPHEVKKATQTIEQNIKKIEKIEKSTEEELKQQIKLEKIEKLIQQKSRTLEEIKEVCERIDVVKLYSGKTIQGAIISRGSTYKILTPGGVTEVPVKDVRGVRVIR